MTTTTAIPPPDISLEGLSHHYSWKYVIQNLSLHVASGEIVVLMGPNGSGKSTVLQVAGGLMTPSAGVAKIGGAVRRSTVDAEAYARQHTVYLPTDAEDSSVLPAREWITSIARMWNVPERRAVEHIPRLLELFQLHVAADVKTYKLSTGQQKKVHIAAAIATDAEVLILDEPFSGGLDPSGIMALKQWLLFHRANRTRTVLLATPVPEIVEEIADRVAILRGVGDLAVGTPAELAAMAGLDPATPLADVYEALIRPGAAPLAGDYFSAERP